MRTIAPSASFEKGLSLNILSVFLNAIAMTVSKFALKNVNPLVVTLIICLTIAILSLSLMQIKRHRMTMSEFKQLIPIALINAAATILLYLSIAILEPIYVGMIGRFYVIFTTFLAVLILKERLSRLELTAIVIAILGTFLFVQTGGPTPKMHYWGVAMGMAYTFLFALANLFVKKNVKTASSITILFYNNVFSTLGCLAILGIHRVPLVAIQSVSGLTWSYAIATAILTFAGLVLFFNSFRFLSFKLSNLI